MTKAFEDFMKKSRELIALGIVEVTPGKKITDFDFAVMYASGKIGKRQGYPCYVTQEEIFDEIKNFAPELLNGEETE